MNFLVDLATLTALTLGVTEVFKRIVTGSRFAPLVSLAVGIGLTFLDVGVGRESLLYGIMVGLSASGLYSGTKSVSGQ